MKIIVALNYPAGRNKAEELGLSHYSHLRDVQRDRAIIVCTDDSFGPHKLRGLLFIEDDVIWVGDWHAGKYADRIKVEIRIRNWQASHQK